MRIQVLAASLSGLLMLGASSARAHDDCDYEDGVTAVERGYGADVIHYDHHHYYYDEYGNPYVAHHDHHYVVPNDNYGYRRQYYNTVMASNITGLIAVTAPFSAFSLADRTLQAK